VPKRGSTCGSQTICGYRRVIYPDLSPSQVERKKLPSAIEKEWKRSREITKGPDTACKENAVMASEKKGRVGEAYSGGFGVRFIRGIILSPARVSFY